MNMYVWTLSMLLTKRYKNKSNVYLLRFHNNIDKYIYMVRQ